MMSKDTEKRDEKQGIAAAGFAFKRRLPLLAAIIASTALTAGCLDSSGDDQVVDDGGGNGDDGGGVATSFKVDFNFDSAPDVQWGDPATVTAFRPGQASYEYLDTGDHSGAGFVANGCAGCHASDDTNPPQVSASRDEEEMVPSKETLDITVQAAYDADNFYLKASWDTPRPGITHDLFRYDGSVWERVDVGNDPGAAPTGNEVFSAEDRLAMMFMPASKDIATGNISFHDGGCFTTCHEDMSAMPEGDSFGGAKYLVSSNSDGSYATGTSSDSDVKDGTTGNFPDMWHFRGARSAVINTLTDGYVMASRANDDSPNYYHSQDPNDESGDRYMYDADWMAAYIEENFPDYAGDKNVNALPADLYEQTLNNAPTLVVEGEHQNAVPFDAATANFVEGDYLPRRWLTEEPGDRTDVNSYSKWEDGTWTVVFERVRDTGNNDDHALNPDSETYSFAFAAHQQNTHARWHHVTFPVTLGMEGSGTDVEAKLNN